jgi:hypothetical protein
MGKTMDILDSGKNNGTSYCTGRKIMGIIERKKTLGILDSGKDNRRKTMRYRVHGNEIGHIVQG